MQPLTSDYENQKENFDLKTDDNSKMLLKQTNTECDQEIKDMEKEDDDSDSEELLGNVYCGIQAKKGVSCINLFYQMIMQVVILSTLQMRLIFFEPMVED